MSNCQLAPVVISRLHSHDVVMFVVSRC